MVAYCNRSRAVDVWQHPPLGNHSIVRASYIDDLLLAGWSFNAETKSASAPESFMASRISSGIGMVDYTSGSQDCAGAIYGFAFRKALCAMARQLYH